MKKFKGLFYSLLAAAVALCGIDYIGVNHMDIHAYEKSVNVAVSMETYGEEDITSVGKRASEGVRKALEADSEEPEELTIEQIIFKASEKYGVDFELALAIARWETGWFKSDAFLYRNNVGGNMKKVGSKYVLREFDTIEEGVDYFVWNLYEGYIKLGLDTPEEIGPKYCPGSQSWIDGIKVMMTYSYEV